MIDEQDKRALKGSLSNYLQAIAGKSQGGKYNCPICGSGTGKHHTSAFSIAPDGQSWKCFSCNAGGDVFELAALVNKLDSKGDFNKVANIVADAVGYNLQNTTSDARKGTATAAKTKTGITYPAELKNTPQGKFESDTQNKADFSQLVKEAAGNVSQTDYFIKRGLSAATIEKHKLGYITPELAKKYGLQANSVLIPYSTGKEGVYNYYITRSTEGKEYRKPKAEAAGSEPLYNLPALYEPTDAPLFVTEGQIDALSIMEYEHADAVAVGGVGINKLLQAIEGIEGFQRPLIIATDADERGKETCRKLLHELKGRAIKAAAYEHIDGYKDINDELNANRDALERNIYRHILQFDKNSLPARYKMQEFLHRIKEGRNAKTYSTGLKALDKALNGGLREGLYCIGAMSGFGKTTLVLQIADTIAAAGDDVLYISLEMSADELTAKSISRRTYQQCIEYGASRESLLAVARTTLDVLRCDIATQAQSKTFMEAATAYTEHEAKCLYIVEGMQGVNAEKVRQLVKQHQQRHGRPPVVFIDYMQLLTIADTTQNTDKQKMDAAIKALKDISRDFKIPVVAISSMNRASYDGGLNMASFKESGNIEYTADVLLVLEAAIPDECKGDAKDAKKKRLAVFKKNNARQRHGEPVKVDIKILKCRTAAPFTTATVDSCNMFNCFMDCKEEAPARQGFKF